MTGSEVTGLKLSGFQAKHWHFCLLFTDSYVHLEKLYALVMTWWQTPETKNTFQNIDISLKRRQRKYFCGFWVLLPWLKKTNNYDTAYSVCGLKWWCSNVQCLLSPSYCFFSIGTCCSFLKGIWKMAGSCHVAEYPSFFMVVLKRSYLCLFPLYSNVQQQ